MGKVAETGNTRFCTYRRLEFIFTERHLESCSNEPAAMKQVMAPEVRENSIPHSRKERAQLFIYDGKVTLPPEKSL